MFDKSPRRNWSVARHQDRTIAVRERRDVPGFAPWSIKAAVLHVEPPFRVLEDMVTLRAHLDDCDGDNAPLLVAPGSHQLGRVDAEPAADLAQRLGALPCLARAGDIWLQLAWWLAVDWRRTECRATGPRMPIGTRWRAGERLDNNGESRGGRCRD
jgi:hypothetical protein